MLDVHRITTCLNNVKEGSTVKHNERAKYQDEMKIENIRTQTL